MKIHICNYEQNLGIDGILSKFAHKMELELSRQGHKVTVSGKPDTKAKVNHHINYQSYVHEPKTKNTLMVTHITDDEKLKQLKQAMKTADLGICMSEDTEEMLVKKGLKHLATVYPAHDGYEGRPKVVAILTNVYPNGCKREWMFDGLLGSIDKSKFVFLIMGSGWHQTLDKWAGTGFQAEYTYSFDRPTYKRILKLADYALYFGEDEGSMGILDATSARIPCIAPNIGFHKQLGIAYLFHSQEELNRIFTDLSTSPVDDWTWEKYCEEHVALWEKL